ncbi:MAG: pilus assembly protein PilM, partial [Chlamydiia bacterium]|nr:pilus assembly protein PilM [Chlamydiia bacterium]
FNFPLLPLVPKVSDFLEWLCTLPSSVEMANGKKRALIQVENFAYQFVKAPDKNRPREHYQVKVDLTFTAQESMHAREFHSALLEPNQFIDPRSEVKWSFSEGKYRTSFFLKDLTTYY